LKIAIEMTTANHAVLFTQEACLPCTQTKDYLREVFKSDNDLGNYISVMDKKNHSALVESYDLSLYPVLLIVGPNGLELDRVTGGKQIRNNLKGILIALRANSK
tara:strand:- start:73 stop:384 length:312 start_codon:yes stop_codon:yes gene_type:complete